MLKGLMHNLMGSNTASQGVIAGGLTAGQLTSVMQNSILKQSVAKSPSNKRIFMGNIEVLHVSNGYVVNIGTKEGYEYTTHIASTIVEVNEIIAAAMVAFQLENS